MCQIVSRERHDEVASICIKGLYCRSSGLAADRHGSFHRGRSRGLAVLLLRAIALATNAFYYHRLSLALVGPAGSPLSPWIMPLVPVAGGLLVGLMAHYGSDKIRGHGIPEAIEAILLRGARVDPKVAVLKPLSAAIAIGSGGPFGAEGPIIMTGGAFGSLVAQWLKLTDAERTTCWLRELRPECRPHLPLLWLQSY